MSDIRRFDNDEGASEMYECKDGMFVNYEDHLAIVEKMRERIEELEGDIIEMKDQFFYE